MKALTIHQPFASAIGHEQLDAPRKNYEIRPDPTKYRGPVLIHAGKRPPLNAYELNLGAVAVMGPGTPVRTYEEALYSGFVAIARIADCEFVTEAKGPTSRILGCRGRAARRASGGLRGDLARPRRGGPPVSACKIGRNDPCPCGSGKKFKRCCEQPTVVHLFAGSGGCTYGFKRAGFRSLGSFDLDEKACRDCERLTGGPVFRVDLAHVTKAQMRERVAVAPDVVVMSPPCKKFSPCLPVGQAETEDYEEMAKLALTGVELATETWDDKPAIIVIENVPRITSRGAGILDLLIRLLLRAGYTIDQSTHDCGVYGGLAQHRERYLLVARLPTVCPSSLRRPPAQRVKAVGEVLGLLPPPLADHGDEMHELPWLTPLNWIRIACADPRRVVSPSSKGDWRDIPARIRIADTPRRLDARPERMKGEAPAGSRKAQGSPDDFGVGAWEQPHTTVRGRQEVQTSRASVADPRLSPRASRKNGGRGVVPWEGPAHAVLAEGSVENTRASVADPRLGCTPHAGVYGVAPPERPSGAILGHHRHDNAVGSYADPRLSYRSAERVAQADRQAEGQAHSGRGDFGVVDSNGPAPTILGHHRVSKSPAAVTDDRGWPEPTHELVVESGEWVLYPLDPDAPPLDLDSKTPCVLVIRAPDGTWHRPMTDRELAALQGFPLDCYLEGPSSTRPRRKATAKRPAEPAIPGRREHIGNAIPPPTAEAIGRAIIECLRSADDEVFLRGGDFWVAPEIARAPSPAPVENAGSPAT